MPATLVAAWNLSAAAALQGRACSRCLQITWGLRSEAPPAPPSNGTLKSPFAIALDETGVVYVLDNGNYRLQKFINPT